MANQAMSLNEIVKLSARCKYCGNNLTARYKDRGWAERNKRFCDRSCSASFVASQRDGIKATEAMRNACQTPEARAKRAASIKSSPKRMNATIAAHTKEAVAKATTTRMKIPGFQSTPDNFSAKIWRLRDFRGVVHEFKNLSWFIKENADLFLDDDLVGKKGITSSRAYGGIASICPRRKKTNGSWKGWTWFSQTERLKNEGMDLLDRHLG